MNEADTSAKLQALLDRTEILDCIHRYSDGDQAFHDATLYGSMFPPVWNFQLALHTRGYGTCITTLHLLREHAVGKLLGIPETYAQDCLLPVARLRAGHTFRPAPRRPLDEVAFVDGWDGPPLTAAE